MRLADAWALLPELTVQARDEARECRQLQALACLAGGFTSEVSLQPPAALLLEIRGSLRLFGGVDALLARVADACAGQGHLTRMALAPTPRAALLLSRGEVAGADGVADGPPGSGAARLPACLEVAQLPSVLAPLSLAVLELPETAERRLAGFGARSLGDLLRLPRAGLARRFGAAFARELAQTLGELPDPRARFAFPETFGATLELPAAVEDAGRLAFAGQRLLMQLCGWLAARSAGVRNCRWQLAHAAKPASVLTLGFASATRDPLRIARLLRERLDALARQGLAAPVTALTLQADSPEVLAGCEGSLFGEALPGAGLSQLVERLRGRLGDAAVHGLTVAADHRPEHASCAVASWRGDPPAPSVPRPCWLLPRPQALAEVAGRPQRAGPLTLLAGPERIESGWWDAGETEKTGDVRRDYFVALSREREWLWIYRDAEGWFLHGIYA